MYLYIMRHGDALDEEPRGLSPQGRDTVPLVARGLARLGMAPTCIASSPLLRARQTAALAAEAIGYTGEVKVCQALAPRGSLDDFLAWWRGAEDSGQLLVVGHMPDVALMTAAMLGAPSAALEFKKAATACLRLESRRPGHAELKWFLPPSAAALIGGTAG